VDDLASLESEKILNLVYNYIVRYLNKNKMKRNYLRWLLIIVLIIAAAYGGYAYSNRQSEKNNPNLVADREISEVVSKVAKLMELPKDEKPAMITVIDKSKLGNEAFFAEAQNGDRVLVYGVARKVIIYRPETDKIIEATTFVLPR
jgi:hypothetical protein